MQVGIWVHNTGHESEERGSHRTPSSRGAGQCSLPSWDSAGSSGRAESWRVRSLSAGRAQPDPHASQHTARARWTAAVPATSAIAVITTDGATGRRAREAPPVRGSPRNRSSRSAPQPITPSNPPQKPLRKQWRAVQGGLPCHTHTLNTRKPQEREGRCGLNLGQRLKNSRGWPLAPPLCDDEFKSSRCRWRLLPPRFKTLQGGGDIPYPELQWQEKPGRHAHQRPPASRPEPRP